MARVSFILVDLTVSLSDLCSKLIKIEYFYMLYYELVVFILFFMLIKFNIMLLANKYLL